MKYAYAVIIGYVIGWTCFYAILMQGDFGFYFTYLKLAWTSPGEKPALIQWGAILAAIIAPIAIWGWSRFTTKSPTRNGSAL